MKITVKWTFIILMATGITFYLAGAWYSNLFRWFFDEKLKQELVALLYVNQNRFITGILTSPRAVTIEEVDIMKNFMRDPRVVNAFMIDKHGLVRWSTDVSLFGKRIEDVEKTQPPPTKAILRAYVTKTPKVVSFKRENKDFYEVAVPFLYNGEIRGVVSLEVSREETKKTLASGMKKFYAGAAGVAVIFILTGVIFLRKVVAARLAEMREIVDNLSLAQPVWPDMQFKSDEVGDLAKSFAAFLSRLRATFNRLEKDRIQLGELEKGRWEQILKVLIRSGGALVLDSDNYCLASYNVESLLGKIASVGRPKAMGSAQSLPVSVTASAEASAVSARPHLLDFITSTELLQFINRALDRPGQLLEGNVAIEDIPCGIRVITLAGQQPQDTRTILWIDPQKA